MADALAPFWPVSHIMHHPMNTAPVFGHCNVEDPDVARWVANQRMVLVTIDSGFQTRWVKSGVLERHGVEVIVFTKDLKGPREQHERITKHLPHWVTDLGQYAYGYRVWEQSERLHPVVRQGNKKKLCAARA